MNQVAERVIENQMQLKEPTVYINKNDVAFIKDNCDSYYERFILLALICLSKADSDDMGVFKISLVAMSTWLKIKPETISKYLDLFCNMGILQLKADSTLNSWYGTTVNNKLKEYMLATPLQNTGRYKLIDNDIESLYALCIDGIDLSKEVWEGIGGYPDYEISNYNRVRVTERVMDGRIFPARPVSIYYSNSGKPYANLRKDGKQCKVCLTSINGTLS